MTRFTYIASDPKGKKTSGTLDVGTKIQALSLIEDMGLVPLEVSSAKGFGPRWLTGDISFGSSDIPLEKQAQLARLLSTLFKAGLPVEDVLRMAGHADQAKKVVTFLERASAVVVDGGTLEEAFSTPNAGLSSEFKTYIAIGDKTNALPQVLLDASELFNLRADTQTKIRTALIYPAILVFASICLVGLMVFFLVPTLSPIFRSANVTPPLLFQLSEALSSFVSQYLFFGLVALTGLIAGLVAWKQTDSGSIFFMTLIFRLPLVGKIAKLSQLMVDMKFLSMLLKSGETISASFAKIAQTSQLSTAASAYKNVENALKEGGTVNSVIASSKTFPSEFQSFFKIAEDTNRWPELLDSLAELLQAKADKQRNRMLQILTPAITLSVGILIGFLVYSILASILQINDLSLL
jgi:general secretion pathway protein F